MSIGGLGGAGGEVGPAHTHLTAGSARSSAADAGAAQVFVPLEAARAPFYPDPPRYLSHRHAEHYFRGCHTTGGTATSLPSPHSSTIGPRGCRTRPLAEHKSEQSSRKLLLVRVLPNESVLQALS